MRDGRRQRRGRDAKKAFRFLRGPVFFCAFCLLFSLFCPPMAADAAETFDIKGLQPLSPYGVFSTFSAESLKQNHVGFSLGIERSRHPDFYRTLLQFAYGLHDRFEIEGTLPYVSGFKESSDGFEDANFGIKHRVLNEGTYNPALAYMLIASAPSGSDELSTDGKLGAGLLLTKKVGPFKGHFNLFYSSPGKASLHNEYTVNIGSELAVTHSSKVLAELVGRKNYYKDKIDLLEWRLGYRVATTDYLYTTLGAGFNIKNRTPDYRLLFSISVILPREKKHIQRIYEE